MVPSLHSGGQSSVSREKYTQRTECKVWIDVAGIYLITLWYLNFRMSLKGENSSIRLKSPGPCLQIYFIDSVLNLNLRKLHTTDRIQDLVRCNCQLIKLWCLIFGMSLKSESPSVWRIRPEPNSQFMLFFFQFHWLFIGEIPIKRSYDKNIFENSGPSEAITKRWWAHLKCGRGDPDDAVLAHCSPTTQRVYWVSNQSFYIYRSQVTNGTATPITVFPDRKKISNRRPQIPFTVFPDGETIQLTACFGHTPSSETKITLWHPNFQSGYRDTDGALCAHFSTKSTIYYWFWKSVNLQTIRDARDCNYPL